ncbi:MAG: ABC transporter substrate-binding protein, partial [Nitriliruptorales bacterium]|nr:ABC transporter substrate-binding protein [Nitriliruptorales bacterium]
MKGLRTPKWRTLAAVLAAAMIAAACSSDDGEPADDVTATDGESPTDGGTDGDGSAGGEFTYQTGIFEEPTTDNFWAYYDPDSSVWNGYILGGTTCSLYTLLFPDVEIISGIANEEPPPTPEGDGPSTVTVTIKDGVQWSDGEPVTAEDIVFTYNTARDLTLGGNWLSAYPYPSEEGGDATVIESVEAQDESTVVFTFNNKPGLGIWPNQVGLAPIMPEHFWADTVEEAKGSEDAATTLYEASGADAPSCGPVIFEEIEAGAFARVSANPDYYDSGTTYSYDASGGGEFTEGPYFSEEVFSLYGGQDPAVLALQQGEVD